ncbi:MAG: nuclear transport factor 2 family protein [Fimbriimonadaceae bacterium]
MKISRLLLVSAFALVSVTAFSDQAGDIKSLEKAYAKLKAAIVRKDIKAIMGMCSADFSWTDPKGMTMSAKDFHAMMKGQFAAPGLRFNKLNMINDSYDFDGNIARVRSRSEMSMSMNANGQKMTMSSSSEGVDTWVKTPKGWLIKKVEVVNEVMGG